MMAQLVMSFPLKPEDVSSHPRIHVRNQTWCCALEQNLWEVEIG